MPRPSVRFAADFVNFFGSLKYAPLFEKKKSTLDGALQYAKAALETYPKAKVTIEPIEIGFWKFLVTVDRGEESLSSIKENL